MIDWFRQPDSIFKREKINLIVRLFFFLTAVFFQTNCSSPSENKDKRAAKDTVKLISKPVQTVMHWHGIKVNDSTTNELKLKFTIDQLSLIAALNRIDADRMFRKDSLIIPDKFLDWMKYSPFPDSVPSIFKVKKLILISYPTQAFAVYEYGKQIRWGPNSMGAEKMKTPTGLFHTNWKAKHTTSTVNSEWKLDWYFNIENFSGVSLHEYVLPGFPASHSCIRLRRSDAQWFYDWADQWKLDSSGIHVVDNGTPVIIFGKYDFTKAVPWTRLLKNPDALQIDIDSVKRIVAPFLDAILQD